MTKIHKGLFHINRGKRLTAAAIEDSELFILLQERSHHATWEAAIRIVDDHIDSLESSSGEYDWSRLAKAFGYSGTESLNSERLFRKMCEKAAKGHGETTNKMMGVFFMWRFAHRDGWFAYVQDTGKYDKIRDKEITVTCYFKKK